MASPSILGTRTDYDRQKQITTQRLAQDAQFLTQQLGNVVNDYKQTILNQANNLIANYGGNVGEAARENPALFDQVGKLLFNPQFSQQSQLSTGNLQQTLDSLNKGYVMGRYNMQPGQQPSQQQAAQQPGQSQQQGGQSNLAMDGQGSAVSQSALQNANNPQQAQNQPIVENQSQTGQVQNLYKIPEKDWLYYDLNGQDPNVSPLYQDGSSQYLNWTLSSSKDQKGNKYNITGFDLFSSGKGTEESGKEDGKRFDSFLEAFYNSKKEGSGFFTYEKFSRLYKEFYGKDPGQTGKIFFNYLDAYIRGKDKDGNPIYKDNLTSLGDAFAKSMFAVSLYNKNGVFTKDGFFDVLNGGGSYNPNVNDYDRNFFKNSANLIGYVKKEPVIGSGQHIQNQQPVQQQQGGNQSSSSTNQLQLQPAQDLRKMWMLNNGNLSENQKQVYGQFVTGLQNAQNNIVDQSARNLESKNPYIERLYNPDLRLQEQEMAQRERMFNQQMEMEQKKLSAAMKGSGAGILGNPEMFKFVFSQYYNQKENYDKQLSAMSSSTNDHQKTAARLYLEYINPNTTSDRRNQIYLQMSSKAKLFDMVSVSQESRNMFLSLLQMDPGNFENFLMNYLGGMMSVFGGSQQQSSQPQQQNQDYQNKKSDVANRVANY